jgi:hypothetical protein
MPVSAPTAPAGIATQAVSGQIRTEMPREAARKALLPLEANEPFSYWVGPTEIFIQDGEPFYLPLRISIVGGAQGVGPDGSPALLHAYQSETLGRVQVPLDFEVRAWGEAHRGYLCEMEIGEDRLGKRLVHYHDIWTRYLVLGASVQREFDAAGWQDFCRRVETLIGQAPHPTVVAFETSRVRALISGHQQRAAISPANAEEAGRLATTLRRPGSKSGSPSTRTGADAC